MHRSAIALVGACLLLSACSADETLRAGTTRTSLGAVPEGLPAGSGGVVDVRAVAETQPVAHGGDAADDPAIWVNRANPALSTVIGTDKKGALNVYALSGDLIQSMPVGGVNNVDLRHDFRLDGERVTLVTAGNIDRGSLEVFAVDPRTRRLRDVAARTIGVGEDVYGSCMYVSPRSGKHYAFVNERSGAMSQWELVADGAAVDARRVRSFSLGSQPEGCVADDETGQLYVGEEAVAIWRYGAEPDAGAQRTAVDVVGGHVVADIEGMAIADGPARTGHLIVSSQGNSTFAVYRRAAGNAFVGSFRVVDGAGVDGVSDTDGVDVTSTPLGAGFPGGLFVAQDGDNPGANQNFKLVPLGAILAGLSSAP